MNIPNGTYRARPIEADLGYTSTGKEQAAVLLEIVEGEYTGERITWYGYFSEKTQERTLESLRLCGWKGIDVSDLSGIDGTADVTIVVESEEWNGNTRAKVRWINAPGGGGMALSKPMEPDKRKAFAARMRAVAARVAPPSTPVRAAPPKRDEANPPPVTDDDLPF